MRTRSLTIFIVILVVVMFPAGGAQPAAAQPHLRFMPTPGSVSNWVPPATVLDSAPVTVAANRDPMVALPLAEANQAFTSAARMDSYSISGSVLNSGGGYIPDVTISAGAAYSTTTDSNGDYTLSGLEAGAYTVVPEKIGYIFFPVSRTVTVPPDALWEIFAGRVDDRPKLTYLSLVQDKRPWTIDVRCWDFPQDTVPTYWLYCVDNQTEYEIGRINVSYTQAWSDMEFWPTIPNHYAIEADARITQGQIDYRIFFAHDYTDLYARFYLFGVNARAGTYSLIRADPGVYIPLIDWTSSPHIHRNMESNRLRVERDGNQISLSVNGQFLASVTDDTYRGGHWGVYTRNTERNSIVRFSNMQITQWPP